MSDQGFPVIQYDSMRTPSENGVAHGESFRNGIRELIEIRRTLMGEKNPDLSTDDIAGLANEQWAITQAYDSDFATELAGICKGANVSIEDIVILNNYTDFRDIQVVDQGCSVVMVNYNKHPVVGQTWDMHGSAKDYVCCIDLQDQDGRQTILFSIVGCVGMMGFRTGGTMLGVNNINTDGATAGVLWPCLVRRALQADSVNGMADELIKAPVTSGHSYLLASQTSGEFWEIMPGLAEKVSDLQSEQDGFLFHTNHCVGEKARQRETAISMNSTTHIRYDLLEKKLPSVRTLDDVYELLNDHENYPKSICSNFQTDSQDPSITCGGAAGDLQSGEIVMWRGDEIHDENFKLRKFQIG